MIPIQNLDDVQRNTIAEALRIIANVIAAPAQPAVTSQPASTVQQPVQPDPVAVAAQQQAAQQQAAATTQQTAQPNVAAQQQAATSGPVTMDMLLNRLKALNPQTGGQLKAHAEGIFQKYGSTTGLAGLKNEVLGDVLREMETLAAQLMAPQGGMQ